MAGQSARGLQRARGGEAGLSERLEPEELGQQFAMFPKCEVSNLICVSKGQAGKGAGTPWGPGSSNRAGCCRARPRGGHW